MFGSFFRVCLLLYLHKCFSYPANMIAIMMAPDLLYSHKGQMDGWTTSFGPFMTVKTCHQLPFKQQRLWAPVLMEIAKKGFRVQSILAFYHML